jgi:hypothetical protein
VGGEFPVLFAQSGVQLRPDGGKLGQEQGAKLALEDAIAARILVEMLPVENGWIDLAAPAFSLRRSPFGQFAAPIAVNGPYRSRFLPKTRAWQCICGFDSKRTIILTKTLFSRIDKVKKSLSGTPDELSCKALDGPPGREPGDVPIPSRAAGS